MPGVCMPTRYGTTIPPYKWAEGGNMSNKFLPFITDNSGPETIFKALIQRSKGVSTKDLGVIYSALLVLGVSKVKNYASSLPSNLPAAELFSNLVTKYINLEIPIAQLNFWNEVLAFYGHSKIKSSDIFTNDEIAVMVTVLAKYKPELLPNVDFHWTNETLSQMANEDFDCTTDFIQHLKFENDGTRVGFYNFVEFKAYVAASAFAISKPFSIRPVWVKTEDGSTQDYHYTDKYCISALDAFNKHRNDHKSEEEEDDDIPF